MNMPTTNELATPPEEIIAYELHGNCYLNITWHCTLRCAFCPKFNGEWEVQGYDLRIHREPDAGEIITAIGDSSRYKQIVFCGLGEPTLRLDVLLDVARELKKQDAQVRVNTDGLANLVYNEDVTPKMAGLIDSLSISMNAQNEEVYNQHCRPKLEGSFSSMLEFARLAKQHVPDVKLSAIDGLPGVDIKACEKICQENGLEFKRRVMDIVG